MGVSLYTTATHVYFFAAPDQIIIPRPNSLETFVCSPMLCHAMLILQPRWGRMENYTRWEKNFVSRSCSSVRCVGVTIYRIYFFILPHVPDCYGNLNAISSVILYILKKVFVFLKLQTSSSKKLPCRL